MTAAVIGQTQTFNVSAGDIIFVDEGGVGTVTLYSPGKQPAQTDISGSIKDITVQYDGTASVYLASGEFNYFVNNPGTSSDIVTRDQRKISSGIAVVSDGNAYDEYGDLVGTYLGPVSQRCGTPYNLVATGTFKYFQSQTVHYATEDIDYITPIYPAFGLSGTGAIQSFDETGLGAGNVVYQLSIGYNGVFTRFMVNGQSSGTFTAPSLAVFDELKLPVTIPEGALYVMRVDAVFNTVNATYSTDAMLGFNSSSREAGRASATPFAANTFIEGQTVSLTSSVIIRPCVLLGRTSKETYYLPADSIGQGFSEYMRDDVLLTGITAKIVGRKYAYIKAGLASDSYLNVNTPGRYTLRKQLASYCSSCLDNLGTNDIGNGNITNVATFQSAVLAFRTMLGFLDKPFYHTTILARPTSASGAWMGESDQTVWVNESVRVLINKALRGSVVTAVDKTIDAARSIETGQDTGKVKAGPRARTVTDFAITTGTNTGTSASANFGGDDQYLQIRIVGAGAAGAALNAWMRVVNSNTVELLTNSLLSNQNAGTTVSGATAYIQAFYSLQDSTHPSTEGADMIGNDNRNTDIV